MFISWKSGLLSESVGGMSELHRQAGLFEPIVSATGDLMGRTELAEQIIKRLQEADCPSTIGVYGGWGTGKTSLLNLMKEASPSGLHFEYLDVWPYEISGDLSVPLLAKIRMLIGDTFPKDLYQHEWKRVAGVLLQAGSDLLLRHVIKLELSDIERYAKNLKDVAPSGTSIRDFETITDEIDGAQNAFKTLISLAQKARGDKRLIFLIDNLDRCSPENVVRLLESIKNFLYAPDCVWVFAMDSGAVASYIDKKYDGTCMDGNSYLDKIIPEQYHLSLPPSGSEESISNLLRRAGGDLPVEYARELPLLPSVLVPRRLLKSARKLADFFECNPYYQINRKTVFVLILLYHTWPEFYQRISSFDENHIARILANFFKEQEDAWGKYQVLPIAPKFTSDQELTYFLQQSFPGYVREENIPNLIQEIRYAIEGLKRTGLP